MTTIEGRQASIAMRKMGKRPKAISAETGYSLASIYSGLSNAPVSRKLRQAIVNSLQIELWGLRPTERYLHVPSSWGLQIEFLNNKQALDVASELKDTVVRRGRAITFVKPVTWIVELAPEKTQSPKNRKLSTNTNE